jgi:hypothetical protein
MSALLSLVLVLATTGDGDVKAGFGVADLTPEVGTNIPGGFKANPNKGVRDPIYAVACVISDGSTPVALVGIDELFITKPTVTRARERIDRTTKIPAGNVLIAASHTHTGGPIAGALGSEEDPAYLAKVADGIAKAVEDAFAALETAEVGIGLGKEDTISFNRRFLMKDGREATHPGKPGTKNHDQIVRPAGPIDPDVGVLAVRKPGGGIRGVVVNFACHVTVMGGNLVSADYVGFLRKELKAVYGPATEIVFLNGACGDITQVDNMSTAKEFGAEHSAMMGAKLAAETVRTVNRMAWLKTLTTMISSVTVPVAIRSEPNPASESPSFGLGSGNDDVYASERKKVAEEREKTPILDCEVQGLRIGPLGIATNGSEYFVEYSLRMKAASPHKFTWFVELANECIGYVPTAQAFVGGGYEPRTARSSKLAPDGGQKLLEGGLSALRKIAP